MQVNVSRCLFLENGLQVDEILNFKILKLMQA